jgi:hypothetical protein
MVITFVFKIVTIKDVLNVILKIHNYVQNASHNKISIFNLFYFSVFINYFYIIIISLPTYT